MSRSPSLPQACLHRVPDPLLELALARKFSCVPPWCALLSVSLLTTLAQPSVAPSSVRRGACSCARRPPDHLQTPAVELSRLSPTLSRVFQLGALLFCLPFAVEFRYPSRSSLLATTCRASASNLSLPCRLSSPSRFLAVVVFLVIPAASVVVKHVCCRELAPGVHSVSGPRFL